MSTGTNKERLEQNNTLLEDIKTQIQNLPEAGSSGDVKQFSTIEEMQADTTAQEGNLAVVYRSEIQNATVDSKFQVATFPETVVLDTAITGNVEVRYRAVDSSKMFDCMGSLNSSRFRMDCYIESGSIRIRYTSSDGITYTRTDTTGNPVDFGTEICYAHPEQWNDAIGKFIQISGSTFEGLFKCQGDLNKNYIKFADLTKMTFNTENNAITSWNWDGSYITGYYSLEKINQLVKQYATDEGYNEYTLNNIGLYMNSDKKVFFIVYIKDANTYYSANMAGDTNGNVIGLCIHSTTTPVMVTLNLDNMTYQKTTLTLDSNKFYNTTYRKYYFIDIQSIAYPLRFYPSTSDSGHIGDSTIDTYYSTWNGVSGTENSTVSPFPITDIYRKDFRYVLAPTQLTATADYVCEKEFYGVNGAETGTMPNNGAQVYVPGDSVLAISDGYHKGSTISAIDITTLNDYKTCDAIATNILGSSKPYTELEYIQSSGTQYIDTGVMFDVLNCKIIMDFQYVTPSVNTWFCGVNMQFEGGIDIDTAVFYTGAGFTYSENNTSKRVTATGINTIVLSENTYMFARNWPGQYCPASIKLYSAQVYKNDALIRDFIPIKDLAGTACLYDKISATNFYNAGTGNFIAGGVV